MVQSLSQRTVNTFVKGLFTEASELTFPENASVDELNCSLSRDGTRRRRKAVAYETANVLSSFTTTTTDLIRTVDWFNVGGNANLEFLVVQVGASLRFYEKSTDPLSANLKSFTINLNTYTASNNLSVEESSIQVASLNGALIIASPAINTIYVEYVTSSDSVTVNQISFRIRDFEWQGSGSDLTSGYFSTGSTSGTRGYDAANVGWGQGGGPAYTGLALTHPWYSGKDADGNYSAAEWAKVYTGTTLASNGHFILDVFNKTRSGIATVVEPARFRTVAAYSGRVFFSGLDSADNGGKVFFSNLIERFSELGNCFQKFDPTSENLSDLLDTDGGVVNIPDAHNIRMLHVLGASLIVIAENGVWAVSGVDNVFRATEYAITQISDVGLVNENSFIVAGGSPLWWGKTGIYTLSKDEITGSPVAQNVSLTTIQTFWDKISNDKKANCFAEYDQINQRVYWFYGEDGENIQSKYNRALVLDVGLQAFYPWKIEDSNSATPSYVVGTSYFSGLGATVTETSIIDGSDTIINGSDTVVASLYRDYLQGDTEIKLLVRDGATGKLTVARFSGEDYLDWGDSNYSSFAETGYDFMGSLSGKKNAPFITTYMSVTEKGFKLEGGNYLLVNPSSCLMSVFWDLNPKGSIPREIYKLKNLPVVDPSDLSSFPYSSSSVVTRSKVRGRGRVMNLRFESVQGKDFHLVGYEVIGAANSRL